MLLYYLLIQNTDKYIVCIKVITNLGYLLWNILFQIPITYFCYGYLNCAIVDRIHQLYEYNISLLIFLLKSNL